MRLPKEDYNRAVGLLKRYNYNCIKILNIRADIMSIGAQNIDGMPKAPYTVSDNVLNSVIKLQEDEDLQEAINEYKATIPLSVKLLLIISITIVVERINITPPIVGVPAFFK